MSFPIFFQSAAPVASTCNLPAGAVVAIAGHAPTIRVSESTALPAGAVVAIVGAAPTVRVKESSALPSGALVAIAGAAPAFRLSDSVALPSGAVIALAGNAPSVRVTESVALPAGAVVALAGNAPSARVTESTALPSGVLSVAGSAPTFNLAPTPAFIDILSLTQGGFAANPPPVSLLPAGADVTITGHAPGFILTGDTQPQPDEPAIGGFQTYDAILWPPQWSRPQLTLSLLPAGHLDVKGHAPGIQISENVRSRLPAAQVVVAPGEVRFRHTQHVRAQIPSANFSTRGNAPAILISTDGISDSEVLCLMLL